MSLRLKALISFFNEILDFIIVLFICFFLFVRDDLVFSHKSFLLSKTIDCKLLIIFILLLFLSFILLKLMLLSITLLEISISSPDNNP